MLTCLNLKYEQQNQELFNQLSFTLFPGSIHLLKGANASGKTSLFRIISGIDKNFSGEVLWNNKPINYDNFYHNQIAYLTHENAIKLNLSVIENLLFWAELKDTFLLIAPALAQFKLTEIVDVKCKYLSAGMQKKVALARMVISNCKLWLLDEPESNLDEQGRELLLKLLQVKISNGGMALIATHNAEYYKKIPTININDFYHA